MHYISFLSNFGLPYMPVRCYDLDPQVASALVNQASQLSMAAMAGVNSEEASQAMLQATRETNLNNRQIAQDINKANLDLYREQFSDSMKYLERQQNYNSAESQVERLRSAGLNPSLSFGNGNIPSSVNLPSASPAVGSTDQMAPDAAYTDTFVSGVLKQLPVMSSMLKDLSDVERTNIDNQTRDAYNRTAIDDIRSQIDYRLSQKGVSDVERERLLSVKRGLDIQSDLDEARFGDNVNLSDLQVKYQGILNRVLDEQNSRDASRLAIEQFEAANRVKLTSAQISQINTLTNLAVNADWRDSQSHVMDMDLKAMDEALKRVGLDEAKKSALFNNIMRNIDIKHEGLKSASEINAFVERCFGLGFRDIGNAIRSLISK